MADKFLNQLTELNETPADDDYLLVRDTSSIEDKRVSYANAVGGLQSQINDTFSEIEIDVSGDTDVTVSESQSRYGIIKLTGTLTGDINFIVPDEARVYTIINSTGGGFDVTIRTETGAGVVIPQGDLMRVRSDGSNVITGDGFSNFTSMPSVNGDPVVERGSNSNGEYVRFADGTLLMFSEKSIGSYTVNSSYSSIGAEGFTTTTFNFPASPSGSYPISTQAFVSMDESDQSFLIQFGRTRGTSSFGHQAWWKTDPSAISTLRINFFTIARWY